MNYDMHSAARYAMKPSAKSKFMKSKVEQVVGEVIEKKIGDRPYVYEESLPLSKELCADIQHEVMSLGYERYKLVVQVTITEAAQQGMRIASRCLWDSEVDNYAEFTFSSVHMHVNALVFGLYWE